jgi:hypothetical protein
MELMEGLMFEIERSELKAAIMARVEHHHKRAEDFVSRVKVLNEKGVSGITAEILEGLEVDARVGGSLAHYSPSLNPGALKSQVATFVSALTSRIGFHQGKARSLEWFATHLPSTTTIKLGYSDAERFELVETTHDRFGHLVG